MRFAEPQISRRGAFLFLALFSCLQISLGFFLLNGNGHESVLSDVLAQQSPAPSEFSDNDYSYLNSIEPAAGETDELNTSDTENEEPDIITQKLIESMSHLSTLEYGGL